MKTGESSVVTMNGASFGGDAQKENRAVRVRIRKRKTEKKSSPPANPRAPRKSLKAVQSEERPIKGEDGVEEALQNETPVPVEQMPVKRSRRIQERAVLRAAKGQGDDSDDEPAPKRRRPQPKAVVKVVIKEEIPEGQEASPPRRGRTKKTVEAEGGTVDYDTVWQGEPMIKPAKRRNRLRKMDEDDEHGKFPCEYCPRVLGSRMVLTLHMKSDHLVEYNRSLVCNCCQTQFPNKSALRSHQGSPYAGTCSICGLKASNLRSHISTKHHPQKPCEVCGLEFGINYNARRMHLFNAHRIGKGKNRTRYACPECGQDFIHKPDLVRHRVVRHGYAPPEDEIFRCPHCCKKYYIKQDFKEHINGHLGIKPHKCPLCPYATNMDTSLRIHLRQVHKTRKSALNAKSE